MVLLIIEKLELDKPKFIAPELCVLIIKSNGKTVK